MLPSQAGAAAALGRGSALGGSLNRTPTGRPGGGGGGGGGGTRGANGARVPGNGAGLGPGRLEREAAAATTTPAPAAGPLYSGSEGDSESGEEEELGAERRGLKRSLSEMELGVVVGGPEAAAAATGGYGPVSGAVSGAKPGKKTRGRVKIKMEFIDNKLRRYTTFSKRKTGIMKKVLGREAGRPRGPQRVGTRRGSPGDRQSRCGGERRRVRRRCVGGDGCYPGRVKGEGPLGKCGERGDAANVRKRGERRPGGSDGRARVTGPVQNEGVKRGNGRPRGCPGGG